MYKHILVTTDGSDFALHGVDHGIALAKAIGAKLSVVTVTQPIPLISGGMGEVAYVSAEMTESYDQAQRAVAADLLEAVKNRAAQKGVSAEALHIPDAQPATAILQAAKELGCDLICMASHGHRGLKRLLLGSQTAEVVAHASVPVLVVH